MRLNLGALQEIGWAIRDVIDYLTDNSCSDPDCCGGPFSDYDSYKEGLDLLKKYGLDFDPDTLDTL